MLVSKVQAVGKMNNSRFLCVFAGVVFLPETIN